MNIKVNKEINIISASIVSLMLIYYSYNIMQATDYYLPYFIYSLFVISLAVFTVFSVFFFEKKSYIVVVISAFFVFISQAVVNSLTFPFFGTDEEIIDYASASALIHFKSPYTISPTYIYDMIVRNLPPQYITPLLSGNIVSSYDYMPLEAFILIPSVLFHIKPPVVLPILASFILPVVYYAFKHSEYLPLVIVSITLIDLYNGFATGGTFDFAWLIFFILSLIFLQKNWKLSALFLGISIAFKQTPIILTPLILAVVFNEMGLKKTAYYLGISTATVLAISAPFFSHQFFYNIISLGLNNVIPLGLSTTFFSNVYLGLNYSLDIAFFIMAFALVSVLAFVLYRYIGIGIFVLSIIPFLVYSRGLLNYFAFIPYIIIFSLKIKPKSIVNIKRRLYSIIIISISLLLIFLPVIVSVSVPKQNSLYVESLNVSDPFEYPNMITSITAKVIYNPSYGEPFTLNIKYARVFVNSYNSGANGYLWYTANSTIHPGVNYLVFYPVSPDFTIPANENFYFFIETKQSEAIYFAKANSTFNYPSYALISSSISSPFQNNYAYVAGYTINTANIRNYSFFFLFSNNTFMPAFEINSNGIGMLQLSTQLNMSDIKYYSMEYSLYLTKNPPKISAMLPNGLLLPSGANIVIGCQNYNLIFTASNISSIRLERIANTSFYFIIPESGILNIYNITKSLYLYTNGSCTLNVYTINTGNFTLLSKIYWIK